MSTDYSALFYFDMKFFVSSTHSTDHFWHYNIRIALYSGALVSSNILILLFSTAYHLSFIMLKTTWKHYLQPVVQQQTSFSAESRPVFLGSTNKHRRQSPQATSTSSRSPSPYQCHSGSSTSNKKTQTLNESDRDQIMNISDGASFHRQLSVNQQAPIYCYLLTNFDIKFETPKRLLQQLTK